MKKRKQNAKSLYLVKDPTWEENVCLSLAEAIHYSRDTFCVVSREAQWEAVAYYNENGLDATLNYIIEMESKRMEVSR